MEDWIYRNCFAHCRIFKGSQSLHCFVCFVVGTFDCPFFSSFIFIAMKKSSCPTSNHPPFHCEQAIHLVYQDHYLWIFLPCQRIPRSLISSAAITSCLQVEPSLLPIAWVYLLGSITEPDSVCCWAVSAIKMILRR